MVKFKWLVVLVWVLIVVQPTFADDRAKILGIWRLVSQEVEFQATGEREHMRGKNATGYMIFTPEGRMMVVLTDRGDNAPKTEREHSYLLNSMAAYTGIYRIEGDKCITKIDVSWDPALVDTEQPRFFRVDSDRLQLSTSWMQWIAQPEKGIARHIGTWQRAK
jgi:hypothetical protein